MDRSSEYSSASDGVNIVVQLLIGSDGQGCLACCSPWGHKELDTPEQLNGTVHLLSPVRLCNPMDCSLPGSFVHGVSQARIWSGLPFLPPEEDTLPLSLPGSPYTLCININKHLFYNA